MSLAPLIVYCSGRGVAVAAGVGVGVRDGYGVGVMTGSIGVITGDAVGTGVAVGEG